MENLNHRDADEDYGVSVEYSTHNPYEAYGEEDWASHSALWPFDPEHHPLRGRDEAGAEYLDYFDGRHVQIKRVYLTSDTEANASSEASQQQGSPAAAEVEPQPSEPAQPDVPPTPEGI